jgi:hypothetical protein
MFIFSKQAQDVCWELVSSLSLPSMIERMSRTVRQKIALEIGSF